MAEQRRVRFEVLFGRCVARVREARGLTQTALADRVGCSQPIMSQWESGRNMPDKEHLDRLLVALGLDALSLVPQLVETAMNFDRTEVEAADLTDSRGRGVGSITLLPAVKKDDGTPPPPKRRRPR